MAIHRGEPVRCPVYTRTPAFGQKVGCGSTDIERHRRPGQPFPFWCPTCQWVFEEEDIDCDREIAADPAQREWHDARIRHGRYA